MLLRTDILGFKLCPDVDIANLFGSFVGVTDVEKPKTPVLRCTTSNDEQREKPSQSYDSQLTIAFTLPFPRFDPLNRDTVVFSQEEP